MKKSKHLHPLSKVKPKHEECDMDSVVHSQHMRGDRRVFDILMEAQHHWSNMGNYRRDRERYKRYYYGDQWGDMVTVDGKTMTEEEYINSQGNPALKNNLIRRLGNSFLGVYRSQDKEPVCIARDRDEQKLGETMSSLLQYNWGVNQMKEVHARSVEEYLISGLIAHRKDYYWWNGKMDCWTTIVDNNTFFVDSGMRDMRGWDIRMIGQVHDVTFGELAGMYATSPQEYRKLKEIYKYASNRNFIADYAEQFGYSRLENYDFLFSSVPGMCRVIEIWRKEQKPRYRCHDYQNGEIFKVDIEDYEEFVGKVNDERRAMAMESGMSESDIPYIEATWMIDDYWYYYHLSPFGDVLKEGETPYHHGSHPYVFKAYPFIDGEIHSFVSDVIDQQRYTNRLITLYDWIIRASAKGVLMMPEDCLPDGTSMEDIAEAWSAFNGIIVYKPSKYNRVPEQIANNSTNIGITELLNLQLKLFEDISGVTGALQGKAGFSGQSAAHFNQQTHNATMTLLDLLESYSGFVVEGAYKDVKNMQQFYNEKRVLEIVGRDAVVQPKRVLNAEYDLSIAESTSSPAFRMRSNQFLMELWQAGAIPLEIMLETGSFDFGDKLLQSIRAQMEEAKKGQLPQGADPALLAQAQAQAQAQSDPRAMNMLQQAVGMNNKQ